MLSLLSVLFRIPETTVVSYWLCYYCGRSGFYGV